MAVWSLFSLVMWWKSTTGTNTPWKAELILRPENQTCPQFSSCVRKHRGSQHLYEAVTSSRPSPPQTSSSARTRRCCPASQQLLLPVTALMLSTLGLNLDHFKAWIKTDLQVSAAPIFGARGLFTTVVFFNLQLWIQKEQKHVVMSCRYEPRAQLSSTPLQATPFQICFPIRADNSNHFLYWLPSNTAAEDGHSFSKPEATDVRLIIQKLFYLTELKKTFKMLPYMNKLESLWSFCSFMHRKLSQVRDISCFCFYFHLLTFYKSEIH